MSDVAQVEEVADRAVRITRSFPAPRATIWRAFTDKAVLVHWLAGPPGWEMEACDITLQPGGGYRWLWRHPDTGERFGFKGTYRVVEPGRRVIDKQRFDQDGQALPAHARTLNTVVFEDEGQGCRVTTIIRYPDQATRDMVVSEGLGEGMELSYQRLERLLLRVAA
ncbi:SRPBCC family protein [Jannaschia sp. CCS1]|uniref:SRPBCC family protein n=1 Tax=Jannaschia sp. (strain CCS1) TaxID=290400 RepID=UPI00006C0019|nr:SRPBCC family protein [Jannaschia sp. CCS1]ABD54823.1 hypothetical protein Jann_1906 [Jannaschia sp. CCS1]